MRFLHTSDWHLGQCLHQFDRTYEHEQFLAWLLDVLEQEQVDALVVAGDIFDNANPPVSAQAQLYRFLAAARQRVPHLNIVLTAGNHDSPGRIEAPGPLLSLFGATVVGQPERDGERCLVERLVVPLRDRQGEIRAWCIAMPFLRPGDLPRAAAGQGEAYEVGMAALYRQALQAALTQRAPGQAIIATGHCHLSGGQVSEESERSIVIGGAEALPGEIFDPAIAYVALGHLHLAQMVGKDPTRRYSGSPLPMSFSEIHYPHQVLLVDLAGDSVADVRSLKVPRAVDLLRVPPRAAPVPAALAALAALELPTGREESAWPYLQVRVQLEQPEPGLRTQIEAALEGKPVRLARIEAVAAPRNATAAIPVSVDELNTLNPEQFFRRLYQHRFSTDTPEDLLAAFRELLNEPAEEQAA